MNGPLFLQSSRCDSACLGCLEHRLAPHVIECSHRPVAHSEPGLAGSCLLLSKRSSRTRKTEPERWGALHLRHLFSPGSSASSGAARPPLPPVSPPLTVQGLKDGAWSRGASSVHWWAGAWTAVQLPLPQRAAIACLCPCWSAQLAHQASSRCLEQAEGQAPLTLEQAALCTGCQPAPNLGRPWRCEVSLHQAWHAAAGVWERSCKEWR